jgi:3-hydroxyacyl-[acyl-carrier-protein] dehydratase
MPGDIPAVDISVLSNLKQRFPMLMVDKVLSWEKGRELRALKNITVNETHFQGHFPEFPIFPGVLTIECFAQTAGLLISLSRENPLPAGFFDVIGTVLDFHFMKPLFPGEQMETHVTITKTVGTNRIVEGKIFVNGETVASGKLMFGEIKLHADLPE